MKLKIQINTFKIPNDNLKIHDNNLQYKTQYYLEN